jgi:hypothetical protein
VSIPISLRVQERETNVSLGHRIVGLIHPIDNAPDAPACVAEIISELDEDQVVAILNIPVRRRDVNLGWLEVLPEGIKVADGVRDISSHPIS